MTQKEAMGPGLGFLFFRQARIYPSKQIITFSEVIPAGRPAHIPLVLRLLVTFLQSPVVE